jgi:hypothetical protein
MHRSQAFPGRHCTLAVTLVIFSASWTAACCAEEAPPAPLTEQEKALCVGVWRDMLTRLTPFRKEGKTAQGEPRIVCFFTGVNWTPRLENVDVDGGNLVVSLDRKTMQLLQIADMVDLSRRYAERDAGLRPKARLAEETMVQVVHAYMKAITGKVPDRAETLASPGAIRAMRRLRKGDDFDPTDAFSFT